MENCSLPQSNGLRLSIQLCSTNQACGIGFFFLSSFFHSGERNLHMHTQSSLGISAATITAWIQVFRSAS